MRPLLLMSLTLSMCCCTANSNEKAKELFQPTVESLKNYRCPEWFRDAKFGIYSHWNAQTAARSSANEWYARNMYIQGEPAYNDHLKNWGHPSKVGYKDVIKAWNGDQFDAAEWVKLFKNAGAKYVITMANHHDNFDMWDSKYQPRWNSTRYGPKVDVCAEVRRETLKAGLRWGVTTHLSRAYSWWAVNKDSDKSGPFEGVPYDGNDPAYEDLYFVAPDDRATLGGVYHERRAPLWSPQAYKENWKHRLFDLIDRYHPDHLYFDAGCPFPDDNGQSGLDVIAHFYNHNAARHNGVNEGVMVYKNMKDHGAYFKGTITEVMERGMSKEIQEQPKQTDTSIGPWFHRGDETRYKSAKRLVHDLADIVSKNNNLLLNIPPQADGSFDQTVIETLEAIGKWLNVNGEAIYKTRPWHTFGEDNIRFTTRGEKLYAIVLNKPKLVFTIQSVKDWQRKDIQKVELIDGCDIAWELTDAGLQISSADYPDDLAYVFRITCSEDVAAMR